MSLNEKRSNPVRADAHKVMMDAQYVSINDVAPVVEDIVDEPFEVPSWDAPVFLDADNAEFDEIIRYFLVGNAINFCFNSEDGRFKLEYLGTEWDGAFGMWAGLKRAYENDVPVLSSEWLQSITYDELRDVFEPSNGQELPLPAKRLENLMSVGYLLEDTEKFFKPSLTEMFNNEVFLYQTKNAVIPYLTAYKGYEDKRSIDNYCVRFDKRAQLAVCMLYGAVKDTEYSFEIADMSEFTLFADYGIPAYLSSMGVLEYANSLEEKISDKQKLAENSHEEVEIRAATVVVGDLIEEELARRGKEMSVPVLDYLLWSRRKETNTHPHITFTDSY